MQSLGSGRSTLLLSGRHIAARVRPGEYIRAVEAAFRRLGTGALGTPPVVHIPATAGGFHIKSAVGAEAPRLSAVKVNGNFPGNPGRFGLPTVQGFVALLDAERGTLLALMDSAEITAQRTAASSLVAALRLACPDAEAAAFVGCGVQAHSHLAMLRDRFPLARVRCFDTDAGSAARFDERAKRLGLESQVAGSPAEACRGAAIVVTSTPSRTALLGPDDVAAGSFVAAVGADSPDKQELDPELMRRAHVVPDVLAQAVAMGDLHHALAAGIMTAAQIHGDLASVVTGRVRGRTSADEVFVFDSTGTAAADLAAAELVYTTLRNDPDVPRFDFAP